MALSSSSTSMEKGPILAPELLILHLIATGTIRFYEHVTKGKPIDVDYPIPLQRGLDRLDVLRYRRGLPLIRSIPHLLEWCQRPFKQWELDLDKAFLDPEDTLLVGPFPTSLCESLACVGSDVEADLTEQHFISSVFAACQAAKVPQAYVDFRRLLIERPVLTELELLEVRNQYPTLDLLAEHLNAAYEEAPLDYLVDGYFSCCPTCGNLRQPSVTQERFNCEDERCRRIVQSRRVAQNERRLAAREHVFWLKRGLRRFITMPGRAELRLEKRLLARGLQVEMWPEFDRYDLRVLAPDGKTAWLVDVKDWANPFLLGCHVKGISSSLPWQRAYYVFPKERQREQPDYVATFVNTCNSDKGHVSIGGKIRAAFEEQFLRDIARHLQGGKDAH